MNESARVGAADDALLFGIGISIMADTYDLSEWHGLIKLQAETLAGYPYDSSEKLEAFDYQQ